MIAPPRMVAANRWIVWRFVRKPGKTKPDKVPYSIHGHMIDRHDASEWLTFDEARAASSRFDGIGFVLGGGFVGFDADSCVENGVIDPDVRVILRALNSYAELSPSGTGVHVIAIGQLPPHGRRKGKRELYDDQFFTFTGRHIDGTPTDVMDRHDVVLALHRQLFGDAVEPRPSTSVPDYIKPGRQGHDAIQPADVPVVLTDYELTDRIRASKQGDKFDAFMAGQWSALGFSSQSEADMSFCSLLAFWTGRDARRIDDFFRHSKMFRSKWDEQRGRLTYGDGTIAKAIASTTDVYVPLDLVPVCDPSAVVYE